MNLKEFLILIQAVLQFPKEVRAFVRLLQKTPVEKHQDILRQMAMEEAQFKDKGRPSWN